MGVFYLLGEKDKDKGKDKDNVVNPRPDDVVASHRGWRHLGSAINEDRRPVSYTHLTLPTTPYV